MNWLLVAVTGISLLYALVQYLRRRDAETYILRLHAELQARTPLAATDLCRVGQLQLLVDRAQRPLVLNGETFISYSAPSPSSQFRQ